MNKQMIKKYLIFILGSFTLGVGVAFCNYANLGVDPMTVFMQGIARIIHVSLGTMNLIGSIGMIAIGLAFDKKNVTFATIVAMVVVSLGIDSFMLFDLPAPSLLVQYLCLVIGVLVYTFGIAVSQVASCGLTAFDCMVFGFMKLMSKEYHFVRWIVDGTALVLGYLLKGTIGVCTLVIVLAAGKLVEFFIHMLSNEKTVS